MRSQKNFQNIFSESRAHVFSPTDNTKINLEFYSNAHVVVFQILNLIQREFHGFLYRMYRLKLSKSNPKTRNPKPLLSQESDDHEDGTDDSLEKNVISLHLSEKSHLQAFSLVNTLYKLLLSSLLLL